MDQGKLKDLSDVLLALRLIDQCHDKRLISNDDFMSYYENLNGKAHTAIDALLV